MLLSGGLLRGANLLPSARFALWWVVSGVGLLFEESEPTYGAGGGADGMPTVGGVGTALAEGGAGRKPSRFWNRPAGIPGRAGAFGTKLPGGGCPLA